MVRQITYCGQNWHAEREEGSFLPAPDQTKARMGEGQAEESMNIHTQSQPLLCLDNRDTEKYKEERGYPQSSFWHQFLASTWLWHLLQHLPCTCSPAAEQRWHGRLSPASSSKDLLGTEARGMEKPLPALQKAVRSGVSSDEYFLVYNLLNSVKRTSAFLGEYLHLARWIFAICLWQRPQ